MIFVIDFILILLDIFTIIILLSFWCKQYTQRLWRIIETPVLSFFFLVNEYNIQFMMCKRFNWSEKKGEIMKSHKCILNLLFEFKIIILFLLIYIWIDVEILVCCLLYWKLILMANIVGYLCFSYCISMRFGQFSFWCLSAIYEVNWSYCIDWHYNLI